MHTLLQIAAHVEGLMPGLSASDRRTPRRYMHAYARITPQKPWRRGPRLPSASQSSHVARVVREPVHIAQRRLKPVLCQCVLLMPASVSPGQWMKALMLLSPVHKHMEL